MIVTSVHRPITAHHKNIALCGQQVYPEKHRAFRHVTDQTAREAGAGRRTIASTEKHTLHRNGRLCRVETGAGKSQFVVVTEGERAKTV